MSDFLLELRCEEIPARMQAGARADLERLFRGAMDAAGVALGGITVWSTPRRLALIARDLPLATAAVSEELKGPRVGAPPQALEGFLRKTGLNETDLTERDGVLFAVLEKPGRATAEVLAEAVPALVRAFPWPKSQRWGAASISTESLRWVRPLSGIVALLGGEVVPFEIDGIASGRLTLGHRFHSAGEIAIAAPSEYSAKLRAAHVIVDQAEREALIREQAKAVAAAEGLVLVEDEGLVIENAGLTEWPVPLLGRFDAAYLDVPPEVIQLTARTNQKYFVCNDAAGKLANAFVCTANIVARDCGAEIVAGNRKVLAARLSDARFFWEQDRKVSLEEQAKKLGRITFHEKLGTVADKVERVADFAEWLATQGIASGCEPAIARQAAALCKADLVTEMVGEFPELQGLMGGYYARAEGLPSAVADAIRDHYRPAGQGDSVPKLSTSIVVALADKIDTLVCFFATGMKPSGSKDPFALRRAAIGIISIILENNLRFSLRDIVAAHSISFMFDARESRTLDAASDIQAALAESVGYSNSLEIMKNVIQNKQLVVIEQNSNVGLEVVNAIQDIWFFLIDRLKVQQKDQSVRFDIVDSVFALGATSVFAGEGDLVRLLARVHALQAFVGTEDGTNLLAGYKRAANILKKEGVTSSPLPVGEGPGVGAPRQPDGANPHPTLPTGEGSSKRLRENQLSYTPDPAEKALIDALGLAGPTAAAAVSEERFADAMAALATLRAPIDAFFEEVTVNDADPAKRDSRLALLARFRDAVHGVADFSRIEG